MTRRIYITGARVSEIFYRARTLPFFSPSKLANPRARDEECTDRRARSGRSPEYFCTRKCFSLAQMTSAVRRALDGLPSHAHAIRSMPFTLISFRRNSLAEICPGRVDTRNFVPCIHLHLWLRSSPISIASHPPRFYSKPIQNASRLFFYAYPDLREIKGGKG